MMGGIIGDIVGSIYEFHNFKSKDFELFTPRNFFTDDTVLTIATAHALLEDHDFGRHYRAYARIYPHRGYGPMFKDWYLSESLTPYWSMGNGSAMRVGPVVYAAKSVAGVLELARKSAEVTHSHDEGIRGAQAVALAIYLARFNTPIKKTRKIVSEQFGYKLNRTVDEIRPKYRFDVTCEGSVPEALTCVFEASSFEDAIRNAVSIGGDSDTIACIAGSIAEPYFGIPPEIESQAKTYLDPNLRSIIDQFEKTFLCKHGAAPDLNSRRNSYV